MDGYERRCRLLLRGYPRRFRQSRGDEIVGTLLDLREPGRTAPSIGDAYDILRAGVAVRLRGRPPLRCWLFYRLFNKPVPYDYRWWARDDILGRLYVARLVLSWSVFNYLPLLILFIENDIRSWGLWAATLAATYLLTLAVRGKMRRQMLAKHAFGPDGTPVSESTRSGWPRARCL